MQGGKILLAALIFCVIQGSFCQSIVLTPTQANVDMNMNFTFTCKYIGYDVVQLTRWSVGKTTSVIVRYQNGTCSGSGLFANNKKYNVNCPSDTSFTVTILSVDFDDHNVKWDCFDFNRKSNSVTIFVKVLVKDVILSAPSSSFLKEHSRHIFKCNTSPARPKPSIRWFVYEFNSNMKYEIVVNSSSQIISSMNEGIVVESTLQLYPNRSINRWMLNCKASTDNGTRTVQSKKVTLNIAYPPDKAPDISELKDGLNYSLIEYEVGKLSCSAHGGNPLPNLTWNCYYHKPASLTIEGNNVTSTVTWTGLRGQLSCSCMSNHSWSETMKVTTAVINVLYPPNKPAFSISNTDVSDVIQVILNNTVHIKCKSISNPRSNYSWTGPSDFSRISQILRVTINGKQNSMFKCTTRNEMLRQNGTHVNGQNESSITMHVMYTPEKPNFNYELKNGTLVSAGTVIDVIAGDSFSIHCNAKGNPLPSYLWDDRISNVVLKLTSITSDTNKTCNASNTMEETVGERRIGLTSASFSIRVLHPPSTPTITISNGTKQLSVTTLTIQIRETDDIKLICFSEGKPYPNYTWTSPSTHIHRNIRKLANISRKDTGNYTCNVDNLMYRTFDGMEPGSNSSSIFLNIMYPSVILPLKDIDILEGSNLNVTCQVQKGNPTLESIAWKRSIDTTYWGRNQLIITNVSRADDTKYTCTLQSTIKPIIGDETLTVTNRTFHLNVFFPSEIKNFTVKDSKSRGTFIVYKTEKVSLECTAEANPASKLSIINPQGNTVSTTKETNVFHYNISNASYKNAGRYICEGRNNFTKSKSSVSELIMIVKCPPRPSPSFAFDKKVAASQYTNTTLRFVAHEYLDEHNKTEFIWFKQKTQLALIRYDVKFEIHIIGLDSSLTIKNITQADFGEYSVKVLNTIGEYIHHYVLQAEDKLDVPINFTYIPGSTTDSSVILIWKPGFDGGFQQTFVLLYKFGKAEKWDSVQVKETNVKTMNYTLTGLLSSKVYDMKIFAKNQLGNSSTTRVLQITTEVKVTASYSQSSHKAGKIGGSISGVAVFITVSIIFAVIYFRKRSRMKYQQNSNILHQNTVVSCSETDLPNPYERLESIRKDINTYSELQEVQKRDKDSYNDRIFDADSDTLEIDHEKAIYINMKI